MLFLLALAAAVFVPAFLLDVDRMRARWPHR